MVNIMKFKFKDCILKANKEYRGGTWWSIRIGIENTENINMLLPMLLHNEPSLISLFLTECVVF